jgi:PAS domain S-box-containing protein
METDILGAADRFQPDEPTASTTVTRVLICDDAEDVRFLLRMQLAVEADLELVGEACDGLEAIGMARELNPDIVLLDLAMPTMDGFEALPEILKASPDSRVVVYSAFSAAVTAPRALERGASAYVQKGTPVAEMLRVLRGVAAGCPQTPREGEVLAVEIPFEPVDMVEARERFARIFEDAPIGMALAHVNGRFGRVNRVFCELVGRTESELVGMSFRDITHPDDVADQRETMQDLLEGRPAGIQLEKRYLRGDGGTLRGILTMSLVRNQQGEPVYFIGQLVGISSG